MTTAPVAAGERPPAVELQDASVVRGGRTVWSDGTFSVRAGAVVGVIGPNGAGKTTLFQLALGLLPAASGQVAVLGAPPRRGNRRIGYVPQNYTAALGHAIRCRDLVTLGLTGGRFGLRRTSPAERARVDQALTWVGADGFAERRMSELVGLYAPWVLTAFRYENVLVQPWLRGYKYNPTFQYPFAYVDIDRSGAADGAADPSATDRVPSRAAADDRGRATQ